MNMKKKKNNTQTLDQLKEQFYGKKRNPKRDELEKGYEEFIVKLRKSLLFYGFSFTLSGLFLV